MLFYPTIENFFLREIKEIRDKLSEYLSKLYGETEDEFKDRGTLRYSKNDKIYALLMYSITDYTQRIWVMRGEYITEDMK